MARRRLETAIQAGKAIHQGALSLCSVQISMEFCFNMVSNSENCLLPRRIIERCDAASLLVGSDLSYMFSVLGCCKLSH